MTWHRIRRYVSGLLVCVILALVVFSEWIVSGSAPGWLRMVGIEIQAACRDAGTQWMVVVCLVSYFVAFVVLRLRANGERFWRWNNPDVWLSGLLLLAMARYASGYGTASGNTQALMLIVGATFGQGVAAWLAWKDRQTEQPESANPSQADKLRGVVMLVLVLLLAGAALLKNETGMEFQYRGTTRWSGPWNNPNIYGILMGMGFVLAVGLLVQSLRFKVQRSESTVHCPESRVGGIWRWTILVLLLGASGLCAFGLMKSYSRGAWLGTAVGVVTMLYQVLRCQVTGGRDIKTENRKQKAENSCLSWLRTNCFPISVLVVSIFVLCFWNFRHTERLVARRAFSVGNVNDFSWRNRVAAWEGALQMMAEKPWFGFGWNQPERVYDQFYRVPKVAESAAIQMNDFFTLGTSVGVPALVCLLIYISLTWWRVSCGTCHEGTEAVTSPAICHSSLTTICHAAASVVMIGFWFDGGLFNLSTGVVFWVLLGLGRSD